MKPVYGRAFIMNDFHNSNSSTGFGSVNYPDATKLLRPQSIGGSKLFVVLILLVVAALVGGFAVYKAADGIYFSEIRKAETVQNNLSRTVSYDFPKLADLIEDENALDVFNHLDSTYSLVNLLSEDPSSSFFDAFKIPSDASKDDATVALKKGIGSMDITSASKLLKGGWRITVDLSSYQDMKVRYTDFDATSIEDAIIKAVHDQGFDGSNAEMLKEGVDESGNTYKNGTIVINDETYFWRVSAVKFKDAYSIEGIPDSAVYVGIRMTN